MKGFFRALGLLLAGAGFALGAAGATTPIPEAPDVRDVLALHAHALGGLEKLRALKALRAEGTVNAGGLTGSFRGYQMLPDRTRNELDLKVVRQVQVNDHGSVWIEDANGQVREAQGDELRGFVSEGCVTNFRYLLGDESEVKSSLSNDATDSAQYVTLRLEPRGGDPVKLALDPTTWLPRKFQMESAAGPVDVYLSDFREVGGIQMPFLSTQMVGGDAAHAIIATTSTAEALASLPDSLWRRPGAVARDWSFPQDVHSLTLPVRILERHVFIPVKINGAGPFNFLLDSGAGASAVDRERANKLGIKSEGQLGAQGVGGSADYGFTLAESLDVGGALLRGQHIITMRLPDFESISGIPVEGILGYDFLSRFIVTIDYAHQSVLLSDPATWNPPAGAGLIPMDLVQNVPVIDAFYAGRRGRYLVDTGNNGTLLLHGPYVRKYKLLQGITRKLEQIVRGAGGEEPQTIVRGRSFRIGRETLRDPLVAMSSARTGLTGGSNQFAGNIGGWILEQFTVTFDYGHHKLFLERSANFGQRMELDPTGWQLVREDGTLKVATVVPGGPAALAGVKVGDLVLKLEGEDVSGRTPYEMKLHTRRVDGTKLHFRVKRGELDVDATLTTRRPL